MRSITLKKAKLHDELRCYFGSNSFGDQLLTFVHETKSGCRFYYYESYQEGSHVNAKADLLRVYNHLIKIQDGRMSKNEEII